MIATRERGVLFKAFSVKAILDDRKTQTRRLIKFREFGKSETRGYDWTFRDRRALWNDVSHNRLLEIAPYRIGDLLYVRETWRTWLGHDHLRPSQIGSYGPCQYKADMATDGGHCRWGRWRRSIFMPKWATRIWLRVTDVRVEQVQDITPVDCEYEGIMGVTFASPVRGKPYDEYKNGDGIIYTEPKAAFHALWDSIHGAGARERNDWIWVISFERAEKPSNKQEAN